jgi:hypothetical protein
VEGQFNTKNKRQFNAKNKRQFNAKTQRCKDAKKTQEDIKPGCFKIIGNTEARKTQREEKKHVLSLRLCTFALNCRLFRCLRSLGLRTPRNSIVAVEGQFNAKTQRCKDAKKTQEDIKPGCFKIIGNTKARRTQREEKKHVLSLRLCTFALNCRLFRCLWSLGLRTPRNSIVKGDFKERRKLLVRDKVIGRKMT